MLTSYHVHPLSHPTALQLSRSTDTDYISAGLARLSTRDYQIDLQSLRFSVRFSLKST